MFEGARSRSRKKRLFVNEYKQMTEGKWRS